MSCVFILQPESSDPLLGRFIRSIAERPNIHCKHKRVDVTQLALGLSELHNNVNISRSITFLDHYICSDRRYTIKLSHVLQ